MPQYDFKSLSDYDFESLVRDLLQEEVGLTLECFTPGRDFGIDLRYVGAGYPQELIIQCKHYACSSFSHLLRELREKELPKIRKLKPSRYLIVTSLGLTPLRKAEVKEMFRPYCLSESDVYGRDDLNNLLGKFPQVERRNFKLWLTSTTVLERVVNSAVFNQTAAEMERIQRKLRYYVPNDSFERARRTLEETHVCIITGAPGIGKTTLAEMLLADYLGRGYEAFSITNDVSNAAAVHRPDSKQIFYYDDFLGQSSIQEKLNKNEDHRLLRMMDAVRLSGNSRFILTTREYLLNQAKLTYEVLELSNLIANQCVVALSDYSPLDRAQVLFNHAFFSRLPRVYAAKLIEDQNYLKIVRHRNFSPRIIEWMVEYPLAFGVNEEDYVPQFLHSLDNPRRIWEHAFDNQISTRAQHLLFVMPTFPGRPPIEELEEAFTSFHRYSTARDCSPTSPSDFRKALKELEGSFITIYIQPEYSTVGFHNPSIYDYIMKRLSEEPAHVEALYASGIFFKQYIRLWNMSVSSETDLESKQSFFTRKLMWRRPEDILKNLMRTFEAGDFGRPLTDEQRNYIVDEMNRQPYLPLEKRVLFALLVADDLCSRCDTDVTRELRDSMLCHMLQRTTTHLEGGTGNRRELQELLHCLSAREVDLEGYAPGFERAARNFRLQSMESIEEFAEFLNLYERHPLLVMEGDVDRVRKGFARYYRDYLEVCEESTAAGHTPEAIEAYAESLSRVAAAFADDETSQELEACLIYLGEATETLENEMEDEDDGIISYTYAPTNRGATQADSQATIEILYKKLLDLSPSGLSNNGNDDGEKM